MGQASDFALEECLRKVTLDRRAALLSYLPKEEKESVESFDRPSFEAKKEAKSILTWVHWSWILETISPFTKEEQKLFLTLLPYKIKNRLAQEIGLPPLPMQPLKKPLRLFLESYLIKALGPNLLPMEKLPPSSLNHLLFLTKKELIALIDSLAFFDLAIEIKQIVETKILKKIYSFLSDEERRFLLEISHLTPPISAVRMRFEGWDGSKTSFRHLLHRRGLARFSAALSKESEDLCWYMTRLLDSGRGNLILKQMTKEISEEIKEEIVRQIDQALGWKKLERKAKS